MSVFDISEFQPDDRVQSLNNQGADGIIVKIGEAMELDPKFVRFVNDCVACGVLYGVYYVSHAHNADEMMQEAKWINDTIYSYLGENNLPKLGIWWDMEVGSVQRGDVWPDLRDAIGTMQSWYPGYDKVGIYAQYSYFTQYIDMDALAYYDIPVWVAQYGYYENSLKAEYPACHHVAWQFTTHGETQDENEWYRF